MTTQGLTMVKRMARPDQHPTIQAAENNAARTAPARGMRPPGREGLDLATVRSAGAPALIGRIALIGDGQRARLPGGIHEKVAPCT